MSFTNGGLGNMLARLHDQAARDTIVLSSPKVRRCEFGKYSVQNKGGKWIGRMWACSACKVNFQ